ncbi:unnamed protein product [Adineta ricciae]|uniref:G-protein coupled receptors family 1 profile domain-containing protein n=1 Tax=Adineta ricciae TaxID=249248 RepID=A0A814ZMW3_ADIRI|nr:unnamed protein product [Adineta ricciae]
MNPNASTTTINPSVSRLVFARIGFQQVGQPILFTLGTIGCLLNICIFLRQSMRSNSCAMYFHTSSWANLFCLTWGLFIGMLGFFTNYYPIGYNSILCKTRYYLLTACQLISRGCVVMACLDRFLLCSPNVRYRSFCQRKTALKVIFLIILICLSLSIYVLIVYEPNSAFNCTLNSATGRIIDTTVLFAFNFGIPALSMSSLCGLIIWRLKQNSQRFAQQRVHVRKRDVQLSAMLIGQVVLYIVTALPFVCNFVYLSITQYDPPSMRTPYRNAAESLAIVATGAFGTYVFNAMNFYVYTLTAPSFRRELFALITQRQRMNQVPRINPQYLSRTNRINPSHHQT